MTIVKIALLGEKNAGKTTLVKQKIERNTDDTIRPTIRTYPATVGSETHRFTTTIYDDDEVKVHVYDFSGDERLIPTGLVRDVDSCALVFDVTNRKSFECLDRWKEFFLENNTKDDVDIVLIGTKADLINDENQKIISDEDIKSWCKKNSAKDRRSIKYFETSAFFYSNVDEAFNCLLGIGTRFSLEIEVPNHEDLVNCGSTQPTTKAGANTDRGIIESKINSTKANSGITSQGNKSPVTPRLSVPLGDYESKKHFMRDTGCYCNIF